MSYKKQPIIITVLLLVLVGYITISAAEHLHEKEEMSSHSEQNEHEGHDHDNHNDHEKEDEEDHSNHDHEEHEDHKNEEKKDEDHDDNEGVSFSDEQLKEFGITLKQAASGVVNSYVKLHGAIALDEEKLVHVSSRFEGEIKKVFVKHGSYVKAGAQLALIENSSNLTNYTITASKNGYIIYKEAALGEMVSPDKELFIIADLSKVWVNLGVYQKDALLIKKDQHVVITDPFTTQTATGKISYISPLMDEHTRSITVRVEIPNTNGAWKPGMFVNGDVAVSVTSHAIVVDNSAIHNFDGKNVVFVKHKEGFEPSEITIGETNGYTSEITSGLSEGEVYVSENGFVVKSELKKSELGHAGHAH